MSKKLLILVILFLGSILTAAIADLPPAELLGDANAFDSVTISDAIYLINYLFKGGPPPKVYPADYFYPGSPAEDPNDPLTVLRHGDANDDCKITVSDVIYLINYLFKGGPNTLHAVPPLHAEQCCCVYGNDPTKCDTNKCPLSLK